jgi:hypothetical protein
MNSQRESHCETLTSPLSGTLAGSHCESRYFSIRLSIMDTTWSPFEHIRKRKSDNRHSRAGAGSWSPDRSHLLPPSPRFSNFRVKDVSPRQTTPAAPSSATGPVAGVLRRQPAHEGTLAIVSQAPKRVSPPSLIETATAPRSTSTQQQKVRRYYELAEEAATFLDRLSSSVRAGG